MTKLDKICLKNVEKFQIENDKLPIIMQKYPWLSQVVKNAIENNINLTMIEESTDYIYFVLAIIGKSSLIDMKDKGYYFDIETFFKYLEDYLIIIFQIKNLLSKRDNLNKEIFENILTKLNIKSSLFVLSKIKIHNIPMTIKNAMELAKYDNLIKITYKEEK
jgi:hypothetical protein